MWVRTSGGLGRRYIYSWAQYKTSGLVLKAILVCKSNSVDWFYSHLCRKILEIYVETAKQSITNMPGQTNTHTHVQKMAELKKQRTASQGVVTLRLCYHLKSALADTPPRQKSPLSMAAIISVESGNNHIGWMWLPTCMSDSWEPALAAAEAGLFSFFFFKERRETFKCARRKSHTAFNGKKIFKHVWFLSNKI